MKNPSEIPKLQTARKRSCNHSASEPKLQTARKLPSAAYIRFNYKAVVVIQNSVSKIVTFSSTCGGTLIDRRTVLTAAHCIPTKVYFEHQGNQYYANVQPIHHHTSLLFLSPLRPFLFSKFDSFLSTDVF